MNIADIEDGAVLGRDVFVKNQILMEKGSTVSTRNKTLLRNFCVKFVYIQTNEVKQHPEELPDYLCFPETEQYLEFFDELVEITTEMEEHYRKFKNYSSSFVFFTKICIPIYKFLYVLEYRGFVEDYRINMVRGKLITLLKEEIINLRINRDKSETMILLVEKVNRTSVYVQLVEGIFHTKGIYPFLLDTDINQRELVNITNYCDASSICVIGEEFEPIQCKDRKVELFNISNEGLENLINYFAGKEEHEVDLKEKLKAYKVGKKNMAL